MVASVLSLLRLSLRSVRDLSPIVLVIAFFQLAVLRQPLPDLGSIVAGLILVILGLITVTAAPALTSPSTFLSATAPPPTTAQGRPFMSR